MSSYSFTNPSKPGGTSDALFLKMFSGEIITTFETNNVMMPLHRVRTISSGKEAQFPVTGTANALYHTPGESILSAASGDNLTASGGTTFNSSNNIASKYVQQFAHNEKTIKIDDVLTSSVFVADIDQMKNHYDVRSIYSTEIGRALSSVFDKNLIRTVVAGARRTTDRFGGTSATSPFLGGAFSTSNGTAAGIVTALFSAAKAMDEKNVPANDRYAVLTPEFYYKLVSAGNEIINRDFNPEGNGSMASGAILSVAGIRLLKCNNVPTTNESGQTNVHSSAQIKNDVFGGGGVGYGGANFSTTRGVVFQKEAVGTVKLMDLSVETEYFMDRLGHLILAKYAMGHDVLREECCYELTTT